jgi:hypothetical protein
MKSNTYLLLLTLLLAASCKTIKPDAKHPDKNGTLILSMERTPCFGRCPVYTIKLYENGLLVYNTKQFTDTTACRYTVLTKEKVAGVKTLFNNSQFFDLANQYPEDKKTPTDLPSCILFYNNGTQQKTITDKKWGAPETLTALEKSVDSLVNVKILHFCDN